MILGPKKLLQLVKTKKLVEGLSERELTNPEGAGFDLRVGEVYEISGNAFLGRGVGNSLTRPCLQAMQSVLTGQAAQSGWLRVQTSAPRSIMPWV